MINREKLKESFEYFDNEIILEIIDIFINEYPDRISKIESDIENKDLVALRFDAHSIKGVIANFQREGGVLDLAAKLEEIAGTAVNKESKTLLPLAPEQITRIQDEAISVFPQFRIAIEEFLEDLKDIRKEYE